MAETKETIVKGIADVDLNAIIEAGNKRRKHLKIALIALAFVLVVAGVSGVFIYKHIENVRLENTYQEALAASKAGDYAAAITTFETLADYKDSPQQLENAKYQQQCKVTYQKAIDATENGDYATAVTLFGKLGDYNDSQDRLADVNLANDFTASEVYEKAVKAISDNFSGVLSDVTTIYDIENHTFLIHCVLNDPAPTATDLEQEPVLLASWLAMSDDLCNMITKDFSKKFHNNGFDISCTCVIENKAGEMLLSITDDEITYNICTDRETSIDRAQENLYATVVRKYESNCLGTLALS